MYKKVLLETLLFFTLMVALIPKHHFGFDFECWTNWCLYIQEHGLGKIYETNSNYPPVMIYFFYLFDLVQGPHKIAENINYLKVIPLIFDLLPVAIFLLYRRRYDLKNGYHLFLLFNFAYLYNSMVWGQVDSIHSSLITFSIFSALKFPILSVALFVLAINMKIQSIIFLPILILCLSAKIKSFKTALSAIITGIALQFILLLPFILSGTAGLLWNVLMRSNGAIPLVSVSALNFWYLIFKNPAAIADSDLFSGLSYNTIGLILFFTTSSLALTPLALKTLRDIRLKERSKKYLELAFLSSGIVALCFFFFNTEMHERYSHPALILFFFYGVYKRSFVLYFVVSLAYLLNMEKILHFFEIPYHTLIFNDQVIACMFLYVLCAGFFALYKNYNLRNDLLILRKGANGK